MKNKRLVISIALGAILGIFCVIGVSARLGYVGNELFILATWVNRIIIGLVIGLAPNLKIKDKTRNTIFRGALLGFIISGSFYLATSFKDTPGFFAGIVYGIIIDVVVSRLKN